MRRNPRGLALVVTSAVFCAGACSNGSARDAKPTRTEVATTVDQVSSSTRPATWLLNVSRSEAIDAVRATAGGLDKQRNNGYTAKLSSWSDVQAASGTEPSRVIGPSQPVWSVEVQGKYYSAFGTGQLFDWGVVVLDASTGHLVYAESGPGEPPNWWTQVPDDQPAE
jgi:hypothetical protein